MRRASAWLLLLCLASVVFGQDVFRYGTLDWAGASVGVFSWNAEGESSFGGTAEELYQDLGGVRLETATAAFTATLDLLGLRGWEMVGVASPLGDGSGLQFYFKRQLR